MPAHDMFPLLRTLAAVYETGQFTAAADELGISQPTVSARIAALEAEAGVPLFVRKARSDVEPTAAGTLLYRAAATIGDTWRDACDEAVRASRTAVRMRACFSLTAASVLMPAALAALEPRLDRYDLTFRAVNSDVIVDLVGRKEAEFGVIEKPVINDAIDQKADIYLTGDLKYHDFQHAEGRITLVDIGHFESEQFTKELIYSIISKKFSNFACFISQRGRSFVNYI